MTRLSTFKLLLLLQREGEDDVEEIGTPDKDVEEAVAESYYGYYKV